MKRSLPSSPFSRVIWFTLILLTLALPATGAKFRFIEDFTTDTYKATPETRAFWNWPEGRLEFFPYTPRLVGTLDPTVTRWDMEVSGNYLYVADNTGLLVVDISNPSFPVEVTTLDTPGTGARDVSIRGNHAYLADARSLSIVNILNPAAPSLVASMMLPNTSTGVDVSGNYAYVCCGWAGMLIYDVTNPAGPSYVTTYNTPGGARDVQVCGDHAYIADQAGGLVIVDITVPASPVMVGSQAMSYAMKVVVAGDHVFVADSADGLVVLDVSNPASPSIISTSNTSGEDIALAGDCAYLAHWTAGLEIYDVSDPTAPILMQTVDLGTGANYLYALTIEAEHAFVSCNPGGTRVVEIAAVSDPDAHWTDIPGMLRIDGDLLYAVYGAEFEVRDFSDPENVSVIGAGITLPGNGTAIEFSGHHVYVTCEPTTLVAIDVSNPAAPFISDSAATTGDALDLCVDGDHAYVAASTAGLDVFDISNSISLWKIANYFGPGHLDCVDVEGDHVIAGGSGFYTFDVSTPAAPWPDGSMTYGSAVFLDVVCQGDVAYAAGGPEGQVIVDIR